MGTIIKTINPILIDTRKGISETLYFEIVAEQRADKASFKDQIGMYSYLAEIQLMREGKLVPAHKIYPTLSPIRAAYKLSTWFSLFGMLTPSQIEAGKSQLMIQEFAFNSADYWGLSEEDYEAYYPESV